MDPLEEAKIWVFTCAHGCGFVGVRASELSLHLSKTSGHLDVGTSCARCHKWQALSTQPDESCPESFMNGMLTPELWSELRRKLKR